MATSYHLSYKSNLMAKTITACLGKVEFLENHSELFWLKSDRLQILGLKKLILDSDRSRNYLDNSKLVPCPRSKLKV